MALSITVCENLAGMPYCPLVSLLSLLRIAAIFFGPQWMSVAK